MVDTDRAIKNWKIILGSSNFSFNEGVAVGYILGSLVSTPDATFSDTEGRICVDTNYLREKVSPRIMLKALDLLKAFNYTNVDEDGIVSVGTEDEFGDIYLYAYNQYAVDNKISIDSESSSLFVELEDYMVGYKDFCIGLRKVSTFNTLQSMINKILKLADKEITGYQVALFMRFLNAMVYKHSVVSFNRPTVKETSVGKGIINKVGSGKEALRCSIEFVTNFKTYKDNITKVPDIFKLSYKISDVKHNLALKESTTSVQSNSKHF